MTNSEVRKYLHAPRQLLIDIANKEEQLIALRTAAERISPSLSLGKTSGGTEESKLEKNVIEIVRLCEEIENEKQQLVDRYNEIRNNIASIDDYRQRNVIEAFYLNGQKIWQIAQNQHMSERTVKRALNQGRKELCKVGTAWHHEL